MKVVLFCQNPYAFGIMAPIMEVLKERGDSYMWFVVKNILTKFPFPDEPVSSDIAEIDAFKSDVLFVPGNEVPYYLRGLKVQIFHGLAGEKKGHFRIRHYFDLYLTQGPYFTKGFLKLRERYKDFDVRETGWPKLDVFAKEFKKFEKEKSQLLRAANARKIVLYAPTFSPSLTSAPYLLEEFENLAAQEDYLVLIKFHDLMAEELVDKYKNLASENDHIIYEEERNIIKFLLMADLLISDTSSVVYEFLLLDKPVITFKNNGNNIQWENSDDYQGLSGLVNSNLSSDPFRDRRAQIVKDYHPYNDGNSALRMIEAAASYIEENGVPDKRKLTFFRRRKIHKIFGKL